MNSQFFIDLGFIQKTSLRHTPYSILDDETFVTMEEEEAMYVPNMNVGCGLISHVSEPMHVKKSGKMFGFWGRDVGPDHKSVFYMEHFYKNTKVLRYRSLKAFVEGQEPEIKETPSQWAGTGHLIMDRNVYYNRFNTSNIVQVLVLR